MALALADVAHAAPGMIKLQQLIGAIAKLQKQIRDTYKLAQVDAKDPSTNEKGISKGDRSRARQHGML